VSERRLREARAVREDAPVPPVSVLDLPPEHPVVTRLTRYGTRLAALAALGAAGFLVWVAIQPVLPGDTPAPAAEEPAVAATEPALPASPRPDGVPARIPAWAWRLSAWHAAPAAGRGARPAAAPARVPAWYWRWHAWRLELGASG
jgi:hypothetical protein